MLVARNVGRLQAASTQLRQRYPQTEFPILAADITRSEGAAALAASLATYAQTVDLLINAVGLSDRGTVLGLKPDRLEELVNANVHRPAIGSAVAGTAHAKRKCDCQYWFVVIAFCA